MICAGTGTEATAKAGTATEARPTAKAGSSTKAGTGTATEPGPSAETALVAGLADSGLADWGGALHAEGLCAAGNWGHRVIDEFPLFVESALLVNLEGLLVDLAGDTDDASANYCARRLA